MTGPAPLPATPVEPRLRLEFTYEFDDFADAHAAASTIQLNPRKWWRGLFGWVLFIGLAIMLFVLLNQRQRPAPPRSVRIPPPATPAASNYVVDILLPVIPWVLIFSFIWFYIYRQVRKGGVSGGRRPESRLYEPGKEPPPPSKRRDPESRSPFAWGLLVLPLAAAIIALGAFFQQRSGRAPEPVRILLPVIPWLVVFLVVYFFVFRSTRGGLKGVWEAQPALHRPHVVEVYDDRIVFSESVGRYEHAWEAFTHVRETPGNFLLYTSQYALHFLPKRAFPGRETIDEFRELVRREIAQRPSPAFPVVPAG